MIRIIERSATHVIQKVIKPNGAVVGYNTVANGKIGHADAVKRHKSLVEARLAAGRHHRAEVGVPSQSAGLSGQ